jgi:transcriptional regulator with XRE-family HTH domain
MNNLSSKYVVVVMGLRRQISEDDINKIALRLKSCRVLSGLTQEQFAEKFKIPYTTIRNWEYGRVVPRRQGVLDFVASLRSYNVFVDSDWILFGYGPGPSFDLKKPEVMVSSADSETFKAKSKANGLNPIVTVVSDNLLSPWFSEGDVVGGTLIDTTELTDLINNKLNHGKYPVLVRLEDGVYSPRWPKIINERIVFASQGPALNEPNPISVALIRWHEVKYPRF